MHEEIINQLKTLKNVSPEKGFVSRTRNLFVPQRAPFRINEFAFLRYASGFAVLLIIVLSIPLLIPEPTVASLDTESINNEIYALPINIQLKEVHYGESVQDTITDAITEVSTNETNHLNSSLLENEQKAVKETKTEIDTNVDNLLNQAIN